MPTAGLTISLLADGEVTGGGAVTAPGPGKEARSSGRATRSGLGPSFAPDTRRGNGAGRWEYAACSCPAIRSGSP
jgi:hypothetical protein